MKKSIYWVGRIQMLIGIWLLISPFALGSINVNAVAINNMAIGGIVFIFGLGITLYEFYHRVMLPVEKCRWKLKI